MLNRAPLGLTVLGASLLLSTGCGLIEKDFEGTVRFAWSINDEDAEYQKVEPFNPNSNEDVRNNKDRVKDGAIRTISLEINSIEQTNGAKYIGGGVNIKRSREPNSAYVEGVGAWEGIALYDENGSPVLGQVFVIDSPVTKLDQVADILFQTTDEDDNYDCAACEARDANGAATDGACPASCIDFSIDGYGFDYGPDPQNPGQLKVLPTGPVRIGGDVVVSLMVTAGA